MTIHPFREGIWRRATAVLLIATMSVWITGCTVQTRRPASPSEIKEPAKENMVGITTVEGEEVSFDVGTARVEGNTLQAKVRGKPYQITLDRVQRFWIAERRPSTGRTIGLVAGLVGAGIVIGVAIAAATKQSCPFVYSWDGKSYVFDAEPYGGAITLGLERDDYTPLDQLREDSGDYRLLLTNEVNETQYTNLVELWVVDHPAGARVLTDDFGQIHTLSQPESLLSARDQDGRDLTGWLKATDRRIWEAPPIQGARDQRQEIFLSFRKPSGVSQAKLVFNVATGLWGSNMIKEMLLLRGREIGAWYAELDRQRPELDKLLDWDLREELYMLKVDVEEPSGWQTRGYLLGGGPFIVKDRVAVLDVSRASGDVLKLRIRPPRGFWALNSFAVDYGLDQPVKVEKLAPRRAIEASGNDVRAALLNVDDRYYAMPRTGDSASLSFAAPPKRSGMMRTVILHARGYYRLHIPEEGEPDIRTLERIANEPGEAARFAAERYVEWQRARVAAR